MKIFFLAFSLCTFALWGQDSFQELPEMISMQEPAQDGGRFMAEFWKVLLALGAMVAVLVFLSWATKRMLQTQVEQTNDQSAIKVIQKRPISPKTTIFLLEIEGRSIAMAESSNGVTLLQSSLKRETFNLMDGKS